VISSGLMDHLKSTLKRLSSIGVSVTAQKELPYGVQLSLVRSGVRCKVNLYHSKKKGNSTVQAGGDAELLGMVMGEVSPAAAVALSVPAGLRAGSDEAGKGDYFGPLVVAAAACRRETAKALTAMGAADSKKLSSAKIRELFERITEMPGVKYAVYSVSPADYNRLFNDFKSKGRNSLDTLAMAHGKVFEKLFSGRQEPSAVVIDKFCEIERLQPWLSIKSSTVELRVRAEDSEPVVAAASIIARSVYIHKLERLSSIYGVDLRPGAGAPVDRIGKELVRLHGSEVLFDTAKVHFANTGRITNLDLTGLNNL
jgi:ribonuclease HIII